MKMVTEGIIWDSNFHPLTGEGRTESIAARLEKYPYNVPASLASINKLGRLDYFFYAQRWTDGTYPVPSELAVRVLINLATRHNSIEQVREQARLKKKNPQPARPSTGGGRRPAFLTPAPLRRKQA